MPLRNSATFMLRYAYWSYIYVLAQRESGLLSIYPKQTKKIDYVALINLQRGVTPPYREVRIVFPKQ